MTGAPTRTRVVRWQDPAPVGEAVRAHGGLAALRAIADGSLPAAPMAELLGRAASTFSIPRSAAENR